MVWVWYNPIVAVFWFKFLGAILNLLGKKWVRFWNRTHIWAKSHKFTFLAQLCTQIFLAHDLTQLKFWLKKFWSWLDSSHDLTQWKLSWVDSSQVIDSKNSDLTWLESSQSSEFEWHSNEVSNCQIWAILSDFWYISAPKSKKICSRKYGYVRKFTIFSRQCYSSTNYSSKHSEALSS